MVTFIVLVGQESDVPELTKKELLFKPPNSAIARTAIFQWNKLNNALQIAVHQTTVCCIVIC